ncbi:hypothetical protein COHA_007022 [Chlorella ohadii]|uniref:Uncharacterized protein n=1 Tax=Chlorella ohadii TaxID=2649997 RepID=A0AAD5H0A1_9CHLO|nr:hypothetical protein COHA_007022 [Chlorella ohadii]
MTAGAAASLVKGLVAPQVFDLLFAVLSVSLWLLYHAWYYSWHLWIGQGNGGGARLHQHAGGYHRLDQTGQSARHLFTLAVLSTGSDQDFNLAVQAMRNPITAASILGTGTTVGVTTLMGIIVDQQKMAVVRQWSRHDPLTGGSRCGAYRGSACSAPSPGSIIAPEAKVGIAVGALFMSFFALAQALRLFVHYPFLVRASAHCRHTGVQAEGDAEGDCLAGEAIRTCLRGQTFFSLGLRFLYAFIPLTMWVLGGTWLLLGAVVEVSLLYVLDQL